jgi:hypothetical protein
MEGNITHTLRTTCECGDGGGGGGVQGKAKTPFQRPIHVIFFLLCHRCLLAAQMHTPSKTCAFYQILRGKAAECITVIAVAVGRDMFSADAEEVASALLEMQEALEPSDSLEGYAPPLHISVYFVL